MQSEYSKRLRPCVAVVVATTATALCTPVSADIIFRHSFESGLMGVLDFIVAWQDERDDGNDTQILARGMDGLFDTNTVNSYNPGTQIKPVIAVADNGSYVVAWQEDGDGNGKYQVWARGFNADGSERFPRITVNSEADGQQVNPDIAMKPNGDFVVVWEDDADGNGYYQILGRGFYANGTERWSDKTINSEGAGQQYQPSIDMADDGSFVVAWSDDQNANALWDVYARGFHANGSQKIAQFRVHSTGSGQQWQPDVAMAPNGDFVVAWSDDSDQNFYYEAKARGFNANGSQKIADFTLNQVGTASQYWPAVSMADDGSFAAAWVDQGARIVSRVFEADGTPFSDDVVTSSNGLDLQIRPSVSVNSIGDFVVIWEFLGPDGYYSLRGARLDAAGNKGAEFTIGALAEADQKRPAVGVR